MEAGVPGVLIAIADIPPEKMAEADYTYYSELISDLKIGQ